VTNPSSCPSCGAAASGRFCSACGTALAGATCANCAAPLTAGAHFCHRCGTPAGTASPTAKGGIASVLPWAVAALALVSLIALVVGQRFGSRQTASGVDVLEGANGQGTTVITAPGAAQSGMPRAPDISQMSPGERAERLYDRIMTEHEAGNDANVSAFMPMALAAYEMIAPLNLDQHYDVGRIGVVGGDSTLARAEADTILASRPTHLLGLILGAQAARMAGNETRAKEFDRRFAAALPRERNAGLAEYLLHKNDIDSAAAKTGK
jgi:hypothetical protein